MVDKKIYFKEKEENQRLDVFLAKKTGKNRNQIKKLVDSGLVLVNNKKPKKAGDSLKIDSEIIIKEKEVKSEVKFAQGESVLDGEKTKKQNKIDIDILKETKDYLVINKPAGLLVHPTMAKEKNTLANWILKNYPKLKNVGENKIRPGIVHRLDKDASGVLVIAKNQKMFELLKKQFQDREVEKFYKVLVYGNFEKKYDKIDFEIARSKSGKMVCRPKIDRLKLKNIPKIQIGKESLTEFWIEKEFIRFSLLKVKIHSGRTHQIRVHMFASGHPVVGDILYANKKLIKKSDSGIDRLFLQSYKLVFRDLKGEKIETEIELEKDLKKFLEKIK